MHLNQFVFILYEATRLPVGYYGLRRGRLRNDAHSLLMTPKKAWS